MYNYLESILEATFYIVKLADSTDAIFSIMANAVRCDFYWRLSHMQNINIPSYILTSLALD